ncbi:hypothetical protein EB796_006381 [Bugula neritina]|uniref:Ion transport domain-containing protein n=1 Tax=Bugula neritina TaxID=10212 RepID=A0A7J7KBU3_BUGNE|nr:hypothetical protein EB796_006381 [Bugula neritina]
MFRILNDIKNELEEQRRSARENANSDSKSLSQGSEYGNGSLALTEESMLEPIEFEDRQTPVPKCTILHYSPFKAVWDWIVLLLVLYTAVFTPYIVAFQVNETEVRMNLNDDQATRLKNADYVIEDPLVFVDLLVDLMFIADIIINFRTTFVKGGEVVSNSKQIAVHYMKGWFVIDAVAAIPFDLLFFGSGTSDTLTITGVLKLVRLLRLLRVARRADQYSQYATATLLLMLLSFALISHWLACIFYIIAYMERKHLDAPIGWLDALAVAVGKPYLANDTTSGPNLQERYVTAMYFTMTTLTSIGFGNIAPNTDNEKLFSLFAMMIGALMSAVIFGNFSSIMMRMYQGSEEMQTKTRSIKDFISFHVIRRICLKECTTHSSTLGVTQTALI